MADDQADKAKKERSPSFPFISLWKAVDRLREMAEGHKKNQARLAVVGSTWGYGPKSSGLLQTVAALKAFGLIDDVGSGPDRKIQITDLGWRILHDARPGAKDAAIREAALRPRLIAEYVTQWVPDRPTDAHCMSELQLDRGFNEAAANSFLRVFDKTVEFAGLKNGDSLSLTSQDVEEQPLQQIEAAKPRTHLASITADADPYRITFSKGGGIDIVGRLKSVEDVDELIHSLGALKLLFKKSADVQKPDDDV